MFPDILHHAYIVEGDIESSKSIILSLVADRLQVDIHGQDFFNIQADMFGVEEAQRVVNINSRRAFTGQNKAIVIVANTFSQQAQNALLKTLEEPTKGTHFFILTSTSATFLPTILSRVHVVGTTHSTSVLPDVCDVTSFLKGTSAKRINMVKQIMKEKEDEKIGDKDIHMFITELEKSAFNMYKGGVKEIKVARVFSKVQDYVRDTSSSKKLLLEYIALSL